MFTPSIPSLLIRTGPSVWAIYHVHPKLEFIKSEVPDTTKR